jgi:hypothetical protein
MVLIGSICFSRHLKFLINVFCNTKIKNEKDLLTVRKQWKLWNGENLDSGTLEGTEKKIAYGEEHA